MCGAISEGNAKYLEVALVSKQRLRSRNTDLESDPTEPGLPQYLMSLRGSGSGHHRRIERT